MLLRDKVSFLKGVGPNKARVLDTEMGIKTMGDLLYVYPFRYEDRTLVTPIRNLTDSANHQVIATLTQVSFVRSKGGFRVNAKVKDESGFLSLVWFRGASWLEDFLKKGQAYLIYGKPQRYKGGLSISHPEMETYSANTPLKSGMIPVYASTEALNKSGVNAKLRRKMMHELLSKLSEKHVVENLPEYLLGKMKLISKLRALKQIHLPKNQKELEEARKRLKFEEVFYFQLRLQYNKQQRRLKYKGAIFQTVGDYFSKYYKEKLPFELTGAQKRVIKEIRQDMKSGAQMNRLLQGDVGSGKTMVALLSMLIALDNGYQSVLMAPTEILAQQHYKSISEALSGMGVKIAFLSGSVKGRIRTDLLRFLHQGDLDILIGTHAVLEDPVQFHKLGLSIIDEQHRFGVVQRSKLWAKGSTIPPHILVMTATPIPRTLAMTQYGDLDVSVIDELPPVRKEIITLHQQDRHRAKVYDFIKKEIKSGRQVYVVFPLIDESEKLDLANLQEGFDRLTQFFPKPEYQISVVHGRMKPMDKDAEMKRFVEAKTNIMVATTVIEVGVNVPNATVMIIENTERFGLSQLHQLRGRVGRGGQQSYCILMTSNKISENASARVSIMTSTNDGFRIAEEDLKLRGPGDIEGTMQSGGLEFRLFDVIEDEQFLIAAKNLAKAILKKDPELLNPINEILLSYLNFLNKGYKDWGRIG